MRVCARLDLSLPFFWGHEETKGRKPQRRQASVGEAVASPAQPAMSVTLQTIPRSVRFQRRRGTGGKPYTSPLIPASCERSIWAEISARAGGDLARCA